MASAEAASDEVVSGVLPLIHSTRKCLHNPVARPSPHTLQILTRYVLIAAIHKQFFQRNLTHQDALSKYSTWCHPYAPRFVVTVHPWIKVELP